MNHAKQNSAFEKKSMDVIVSLVGIFVLVLFSVLFVQKVVYIDETNATKKQALILAYQLWQIQLNIDQSKKNNDSKMEKSVPIAGSPKRGLASVEAETLSTSPNYSPFKNIGEIGEDEWSMPFHYLLRNENNHTKILVWSSGINKLNDSSNTLPQFGSDDIGEVLIIH